MRTQYKVRVRLRFKSRGVAKVAIVTHAYHGYRDRDIDSLTPQHGPINVSLTLAFTPTSYRFCTFTLIDLIAQSLLRTHAGHDVPFIYLSSSPGDLYRNNWLRR